MADLADRLARGDPAAFAELYDACALRLHHYLSMHTGSPADADDVVQETFVRLARSRKKLAKVENLTAYVFTVARNEAARLQKREAREAQALAARPLDDGPDNAAAGDASELVALALSRLPSEQREIVELKAYAGLTLREIAEITALPPGTVATRYRTAIARLRDWLTRKCHD
ncbi:MAG: RNA polymerase sigma factor [Pirellulales bacterium]